MLETVKLKYTTCRLKYFMNLSNIMRVWCSQSETYIYVTRYMHDFYCESSV